MLNFLQKRSISCKVKLQFRVLRIANRAKEVFSFESERVSSSCSGKRLWNVHMGCKGRNKSAGRLTYSIFRRNGCRVTASGGMG